MTTGRNVLVLSLACLALTACSSEKTTTSNARESESDAGGSDGGACEGTIVESGTGETCVGYGAGDSCPAGCEPYGYVCFGGPPPGLSGCRETRTSATLGNNYCCPTNECVAQPDQNAMCSDVDGKPNRMQCPPSDDGSTATPPAGCEEHGSGATSVETFYCCP